MDAEYYQPSQIASYLSWIVCVPIFAHGISGVILLFSKDKELPHLFSVWIAICVLIFSPMRYLLFLGILEASFAVQSLSAFLTAVVAMLYTPIIAGILFIIGFNVPLWVVTRIAGEKHSTARCLVAGLAAPIVFVAATVAFHFTMPYCGMAYRWLNAQDVMRATNGPSEFAFTYIAQPMQPLYLPGYYDKTMRTNGDRLRCHVAVTFLSHSGHVDFASAYYPGALESAFAANVTLPAVEDFGPRDESSAAPGVEFHLTDRDTTNTHR